MKTIVLFILLGFTSAQAAVVKTKFKVTGRYYDSTGDSKKLVRTRTFIKYDDAASILSAGASDNCEVTVGKNDIGSLWNGEEKSPCVSSKTFAIVPEDAVIDMFYQSAIFAAFDSDSVSRVTRIWMNSRVINGSMNAEASSLSGTLLSVARSYLGKATKTQVVSLKGETQFEMKSPSGERLVIKLTPVKTKAVK
ncbi:MAG: hypothetical protein KA715_07745 [Xanthomonadaceae bacterium]|nr:hypothetical protein [Xanthomonadaceae bacterium]